MSDRIWVAGVGNVFFADDGFGVEVARRLAQQPLPKEVVVRDYGIRGMHLAYDLLDPPELLLVVDTLPHQALPGTTCVFDPDLETRRVARGGNGHGMDIPSVFAMVRTMGGSLPRVLIIGCEPADLSERMLLSPPVAQAVEVATKLANELIANALAPTRRSNEEEKRS